MTSAALAQTAAPVSREGEVARVLFENASTDFRVLRIEMGPKAEAETWVGKFVAVAPGMRVKATGYEEKDAKRGLQFKVETLTPIVPSTKDGIIAYLGSGLIHGIGPSLATAIVAVFGEKTLEVLDTDPNALGRVKGVGAKKLDSIAKSWVEQRTLAQVMAFLSQHGASPGLARRILDEYGAEKAMKVITETPYRLAIDVDGVGFKTADRIALASGLPAGSPDRAQAAALHALAEHFTSKGHVFADERQLVTATAEMISRDEVAVEDAVRSLAATGRIVVEGLSAGNVVYPRALHRAEVRLAGRLRDLLEEAPMPPKMGKPTLAAAATQAISDFEKQARVQLADAQRDAVNTIATAKAMVLTGGPGVGKTSVTRAILSAMKASGLRVLCASPTGRAAKRLAEATGEPATTIHRLLEYNPREGGYQRNAENPLECDAVVVDEVSMLDLPLADVLVQAVPLHARVILVGDVDQLPSVGPGAVLRDVIESGVVPAVRLTQVFRQAEGSAISLNAQRVNAGEMPESAEGSSGEFYVIERDDPTEAADTILEMVTKRIPARFGWKPMADMLVLTPMHKGETGTIALNQRLQAALNPPAEGKAELQRGAYVLRVGDKVSQKKNDKERDIYNGDVGVVLSIDAEERRAVVRFDERDIVCESKQLEQLQLAYASSIHRVQGSEAPVVVMTMLTQHYVLLQRNLLYTGLTRGKKLVVLVTNKRALKLALAADRREDRATLLAQRLRGDL